MNFAQKIDFDALMEPVALRLLGDPAHEQGQECGTEAADPWRSTSRAALGSTTRLTQAAGVFDLIRRQGYEQPAAWLRSEGLLGSPQIVSRAESCIVKNYDYRDENGQLLLQVVRLEPKGFRQRRPHGRGGWIWNLQGTRRVPYRLPVLMKSVAAGQTIYKGEKDVDNLRDIGQALSTRCRIGDRIREGFGETDVKSQPKQIVSELSSVQ
jgi:hypothetical protein